MTFIRLWHTEKNPAKLLKLLFNIEWFKNIWMIRSRNVIGDRLGKATLCNIWRKYRCKNLMITLGD
jgi:hypothetical protein